MENEKIGKYLQNKRNELGITQADLEKEMGVTFQAVSRWENLYSIPDIETLCLIADMYHVSVDEILQRNAPQNDSNDMLLLAGMSALVYIVSIIIFIVINSVWISIVAIGLFAVISLGGLVPANIYYFGELSFKSKRDTIIYMSSYIPLVIGILIVVLPYLI